MDKVDADILKRLQQDGRLSNVELAEGVNLSPSPCLRRVKNLEAEGVITGYGAVINRDKVGFGMTIFVDVSLDSHKETATSEFEASLVLLENVISCHEVSGVSDYRLEVVVRDLKSYEIVLKQIQQLPHVKDIQSNFAIRTVKSGAPIPL
ncbi:Lrp/AsnC family transcriptional regulator [Marinomonas mediterranea]|jgi:transcriptional regulator, AsnC family|uniref:Transcriptional regulator, AsnC family n=1 Tax=Marinomonas mediterranea (strain ATCC 700492 / JCM 21426 / NBRC 103028 / MMB-1) TaxID=717774 RepID=F2JWZ5_MARM1|nr:Lrp/AsnC family transcriptional regulator [Marinomonas mediterranea]ADZ89514.1 transcriptional regulator, AsnC family [Marinomonas mediterranea MMB-1]WCN11326.1 winged helix-turn-helix transcriptional regulator [Marinomonas mediterranea]WCN15388.1 winged helix-turn-helix transcriptional regulator [Marinomonas mediterranea]WCN19441.1 winged helix-turn-helix transcriptional regulator [Marinomonas mediterranea MMB-1]